MNPSCFPDLEITKMFALNGKTFYDLINTLLHYKLLKKHIQKT